MTNKTRRRLTKAQVVGVARLASVIVGLGSLAHSSLNVVAIGV